MNEVLAGPLRLTLLECIQQQVTRESERTRGWTVRSQQLPEPDRWGSASHQVYGPTKAADRPIVASKVTPEPRL